MTELSTEIKKISGVKKNISIFKKDKTIKIKSTPIPKKKSMDEAIETNEVLLWGLNKIDSILLTPYEKNYIKSKTKSAKTNTIEKNKISKTDTSNGTVNINKQKYYIKTIDKEYIPSHTYNILDLDWLNEEYERIDNKINQLTDITDEYDNLLDLQDSLTELINELEYMAKNKKNDNDKNDNNDNKDNNNDNNDDDNNVGNNNEYEDEDDNTLMEVEIKTKSTKSRKKATKLKPYYWIGKIPDGYREATEEEAIINKKVSLFGKKRVNRELHSLFEITGTIYIDTEELPIINQQIMGLKGKLSYYKKELEYKKISLDSDTISEEMRNDIKNKILDIKNCYKKTVDIYNIYVKKYNDLTKVGTQNINKT